MCRQDWPKESKTDFEPSQGLLDSPNWDRKFSDESYFLLFLKLKIFISYLNNLRRQKSNQVKAPFPAFLVAENFPFSWLLQGLSDFVILTKIGSSLIFQK